MSQPGMELMVEPAADAGPAGAAAVVERPGGGRPEAGTAGAPANGRGAGRGGWRGVANAVCVPVAAAAALTIHYALPDRGPLIRTRAYAGVLTTILVLG